MLPEVAVALGSSLTSAFGNPSSVHRDGQAARQAFERGRQQVCELLGCKPKDLVLTGGGTEADNLAILGFVRACEAREKHVIATAIEHPAVLAACGQLEREGVAVTYVQPARNGRVDPDAVLRQIRPSTVLVSTMHANNETGVLQPIEEIGRMAREKGVAFHVDGVQAVGKVAVDVSALPLDFYAISAHKFHALKGVGALYVRNGVTVQPLVFGGRQERSRRAGTENVPGAVSMGEAARIASADFAAETNRVGALRDRFERLLLDRVAGVTVNGAGVPRLPNTSSVSFDGIEGEPMVIALDLRGFAISSGSACSSGAVEPSHVLTAMGLSPEQARSTLRVSLGRANTEPQVDALVEAMAECAAHLRRLSPTYA